MTTQPANDTALDALSATRRARIDAWEQSEQGQREAAYRASHRWTGALYQQGRDLREVAALVRAALRTAGIVATVRLSRYSQGQSLTIAVTPPAGMLVMSVKRVRQDMGLAPGPVVPFLAPDAAALLTRVEAMANAWNRSWSDKHQTFYASVAFAGSVQSEHRAEIEAAVRATVKATA